MKHFLLFPVFLLLFKLSIAQNSNSFFKDDIFGTYMGQLFYDTPKGLATIKMEFTIKETSKENEYSYWLIYDNSARKYTLKVVDIEKGICEIDENNGIVLPAKCYQKVIYSWFEVEGNKISSRLEFKKDTINFEILFSNVKNKTITGNIDSKIPKVFGYPISAIQKAVLKKQN